MATPLDIDTIRTAPKVLLHDHLDGGLRPQTVVDLADRIGYRALPTTDADKLAAWFRESACSGSLERYLETFAHTVAVMQTTEGLRRVARECVEDLAADGIVYAEVRWAPEQHVEGGAHHGVHGGATRRRRPSGVSERPGSLRSNSRSHCWQVTALCAWSRPSQ